MLVRRFTMVCLLMSIFGMGFAAIVAGTARSNRSWETSLTDPCTVSIDVECRIQRAFTARKDLR